MTKLLKNITLILFALLIILPEGSYAAAPMRTYAKNQIRDLALIYQGNRRRPKWVKSELEPYVAHTFADGRKEWTFDGFLFLEFDNGYGVSFTPSIYKMGTKTEWQWYLDELYAPGVGLAALDELIDDLKNEIGDPGFKHKIVLTILTPCMTVKDWGEIDGKSVDMSTYEGAASAAKWYIDQLVTRFYASAYKNLELTGLYWVDEDLCHTYDLTQHVAPIVHQYGLEFIWIPYYNARGMSTWQEQGFDIAYIQPNYLFDKKISDLRLKDATDMARNLGMGLELELDATSCHNAKNSSYYRLKDYIDYFHSTGVWKNSAVAYYLGSRGILDMLETKSIDDQKMLDEIFDIIVKRRSYESLECNMPKKTDAFATKYPTIKGAYKNGILTATTNIDDTNEIAYTFSRCMANELFTFSEVSINSKIVNKATSDNIGPFMLENGNWTGGNHVFNDNVTRSAYTKSFSIYANGKKVKNGEKFSADSIRVEVVNILKCNAESTDTFAIERAKYVVIGNSIQVEVSHDYCVPQPMYIERYYGMQSMFDGETEILTPLGEYSSWTPIKSVSEFTHKDYPLFHHFIEKSPTCYQAAYLCPVNLGSQRLVNANDASFIGNSWSKCYHKQIGHYRVTKGEHTQWKGVYTWFVTPEINQATEKGTTKLAYRGYINGKSVLFYSDGISFDAPMAK